MPPTISGAFADLSADQLAEDAARILRVFMQAWPGAPNLAAWQSALLLVRWIEGDRRAEPSQERWDALKEDAGA